MLWEDFLDAVSQTRLQDEYNQAIRECDVFVMLFHTKVGQNTKEEFETAFGQFKATNCNGSTTRTALLANSAPFLLKLTDNKIGGLLIYGPTPFCKTKFRL